MFKICLKQYQAPNTQHPDQVTATQKPMCLETTALNKYSVRKALSTLMLKAWKVSDSNLTKQSHN